MSTTPRPWKVYDGYIVWGGGKDNEENRVAMSNVDSVLPYAEMRANAELIVRAVNQYDHVAELVEAANDALYFLQFVDMSGAKRSAEILRAALAHFKEEK